MILCANAILQVNLRYVLQLRDDNPSIPASGQWSLFGGRVETGETPRDAIIREVTEELTISISDCHFLESVEWYGPFEKQYLHFSFFLADITSVWGTHQLTEGQDVGIFDFEKTQKLSMPKVFQNLIKRFHDGEIVPFSDSHPS